MEGVEAAGRKGTPSSPPTAGNLHRTVHIDPAALLRNVFALVALLDWNVQVT